MQRCNHNSAGLAYDARRILPQTLMNHKTTIVFVTYNSGHLVSQFLSGLSDFPVIVVDNASKDDTCVQIEQHFPSVKLIKNTVNIGYGRAANQAFAEIDTELGLLVNPDTTFAAADVAALEQTTEPLNDRWLFVAPNTEKSNRTEQTSEQITQSTATFKLDAVDFAGGAAMLFNMATFRSLNGFDENIFLYFEETDLCERAKKQHLAMYRCDAIRFPHEWGQSSKPSTAIEQLKQWHYDWSALYFAKKHQFWTRFLPMIVKRLLIYPVKLRFSHLDGDKKLTYLCRLDSARAHWAGRNAFVAGQPFVPDFSNSLQDR